MQVDMHRYSEMNVILVEVSIRGSEITWPACLNQQKPVKCIQQKKAEIICRYNIILRAGFYRTIPRGCIFQLHPNLDARIRKLTRNPAMVTHVPSSTIHQKATVLVNVQFCIKRNKRFSSKCFFAPRMVNNKFCVFIPNNAPKDCRMTGRFGKVDHDTIANV